MPTVEDIFHVEYGNKLDLNKQSPDPRGVVFIGRKGTDQGVSARVREIVGVKKYPAGSLTVALGGSILSTFVQQEPFYTAQNVAVLTPRDSDMPLNTRLFYAMCIHANRHRYVAFGREANRTLHLIELPDDTPEWVKDTEITDAAHLTAPADPEPVTLPDITTWLPFTIESLFEVKRGGNHKPGDVSAPLVTASAKRNGITGTIGVAAAHDPTITVAWNGSVGEAFYQPEPFVASGDVSILEPRTALAPEAALFICTVLRQERFRYGYGRKWRSDLMRQTVIKLPVTEDGSPDWALMASYIRSLPYSGTFAAA